MGMRIEYLMLTAEELEKLRGSEDILEDLEDCDVIDSMDIDKMWDAMHFVLCDVTAGAPIEGHALSHFVMGEEVFDEDCEEYAAFNDASRVKEISEALKAVDFEKLLSAKKTEDFAKHGIYPDIWDRDDEYPEICEELTSDFADMKQFYDTAAINGMTIVVTLG